MCQLVCLGEGVCLGLTMVTTVHWGGSCIGPLGTAVHSRRFTIQPLSVAPQATFHCTLFSMLMFKVAQQYHRNIIPSGPLFFLSQLPQVHLPSSLFHGDPDAVSGRTRDSVLQVRLLRTPLEGGLILCSSSLSPACTAGRGANT